MCEPVYVRRDTAQPVTATLFRFGLEDGYRLKGVYHPKSGPVPRSMERVPVVVTAAGALTVREGDVIVRTPGEDTPLTVLTPLEFAAAYTRTDALIQGGA